MKFIDARERNVLPFVESIGMCKWHRPLAMLDIILIKVGSVTVLLIK
jgi:hypothetical protein